LKYSLDTNVFIEGWLRRFPADVFPSVWSGMERLAEEGRLSVTEEVLVELERKEDDVYGWVKVREDLIVVPIDEEIQIAVANILAEHEMLVNAIKGRSSADPFVIALAQVASGTVVTFEEFSYSDKRPRIPDVCHALNIPCQKPFDMFRECGLSF
jgi:hypothetical protein